jgi:hypothetical protein
VLLDEADIWQRYTQWYFESGGVEGMSEQLDGLHARVCLQRLVPEFMSVLGLLVNEECPIDALHVMNLAYVSATHDNVRQKSVDRRRIKLFTMGQQDSGTDGIWPMISVHAPEIWAQRHMLTGGTSFSASEAFDNGARNLAKSHAMQIDALFESSWKYCTEKWRVLEWLHCAPNQLVPGTEQLCQQAGDKLCGTYFDETVRALKQIMPAPPPSTFANLVSNCNTDSAHEYPALTTHLPTEFIQWLASFVTETGQPLTESVAHELPTLTLVEPVSGATSAAQSLRQDFTDGTPTEQKLLSLRACFTQRKSVLASSVEGRYKGGKLFYRVVFRDQLVKQLREFYERRGPPERAGETLVERSERKLSDTEWWIDADAVPPRPHACKGFKSLVSDLQEEYGELPNSWDAYTPEGASTSLDPEVALRLSVQKLHEAHSSWCRFARELCEGGSILCDKLSQVVEFLGPRGDQSHLQPWPGLNLVYGSATGPNLEKLKRVSKSVLAEKNKKNLSNYRDYLKESRGLASLASCLFDCQSFMSPGLICIRPKCPGLCKHCPPQKQVTHIVTIISQAHTHFLTYRFKPFAAGKGSFVTDSRGGKLLTPSHAVNNATNSAFPESQIGEALVKMAFEKAEELQQIMNEIRGASGVDATNLELLNWLRSMDDEEFKRAEEEAQSKEQKDCPGECSFVVCSFVLPISFG